MSAQAPSRALLLTFHDPNCVTYGAGQRTHLLAKALAACLPTDVAHFDAQATQARRSELPPELGQGTLYTLPLDGGDFVANPRTLMRSSKLSRLLRKEVPLDRYDTLVSRYITPAIKLSLPESCRVVVDFDDPIFRNAPGSAMPWKQRLLHALNAGLCSRHLATAAAQQRTYLFVSRQDAAQFPALRGHLLPNIPLAPSQVSPLPPQGTGPVVLFVGFLGWQPNAEAIENFVTEVWPAVRQAHPSARLRVVGKGPESLLERLRQVPGCEPLGFVRDLDAAYREAHLCVVPLRSGGGSNIKLPEACAHGRPVVAFRYAHHAWSDWLQEGHDLRVADDNAGFARHCVALLSDRSELDTLAKSGQARVQQALTFAGFRSMLQNALTG